MEGVRDPVVGVGMKVLVEGGWAEWTNGSAIAPSTVGLGTDAVTGADEFEGEGALEFPRVFPAACSTLLDNQAWGASRMSDFLSLFEGSRREGATAATYPMFGGGEFE